MTIILGESVWEGLTPSVEPMTIFFVSGLFVIWLGLRLLLREVLLKPSSGLWKD